MSTPADETTERRRFNVDEYHRLGAAGILGDDERVELILGELVTMTPIGPQHMTCINLLIHVLSRALGDRAVVSPQNGVKLSDCTELYPDVALLRGPTRRYAAGLPHPEDVLLVIEVADASLHHDRNVKAPRYAAAGIAELWIIDLNTQAVEVCRAPEEGGYTSFNWLGPADTLTLLGFFDIRIPVSDLLP